MKRLMYISMLCIAAAMVIVGCCRCGSKSRNAATLAGNTWQLVKLMGQDVEADGDSFTLTFTDDGRVNGKGSCNRVFGDYQTTADGKIAIDHLGSTRMMCPDVDREDLYFRTVGNAAAYEIDGDMLMLLNDGEVQAVFALKAPAEKE